MEDVQDFLILETLVRVHILYNPFRGRGNIRSFLFWLKRGGGPEFGIR